ARTTYTEASLPLLSGRSTASITPSSISACSPAGVFMAPRGSGRARAGGRRRRAGERERYTARPRPPLRAVHVQPDPTGPARGRTGPVLAQRGRAVHRGWLGEGRRPGGGTARPHGH